MTMAGCMKEFRKPMRSWLPRALHPRLGMLAILAWGLLSVAKAQNGDLDEAEISPFQRMELPEFDIPDLNPPALPEASSSLPNAVGPDGNGGDPASNDVPVDGGLGLLLLTGAALGVRRVKAGKGALGGKRRRGSGKGEEA